MTEQYGEFEWNIDKAASNLEKHGIAFKEAATVFNDFGLVCDDDKEHSEEDEKREIAIGYSSQNRLITVCFTERENITRIISARKSTSIERKQYENA